MDWDIIGKGVIHTPPVEKTVTLHNGRIVDYAIMTQSMHCLVQQTIPIYDAPCRPHIGIMYKIASRPRQIMIPKFIRPRKIEAKGDIREPMSIEACYEKAKDFQKIKLLPEIIQEYAQSLPDPAANDRMATEYKRISAAYEMYIASKHASTDKDIQKSIGRGDSPKIQWSPVVPKKPPEYAHRD